MEKGQSIVLLVSGWRGMTDQPLFDTGMANFIATYGTPERIITGGAKGADALAKTWAIKEGIAYSGQPAQWKKLSKAAGPMRNSDLVRECTHVLAFPHPEGRGTQDAMRKAEAAGKPMIVYDCVSGKRV